MSEEEKSNSSTSESEVSACSSSFKPEKALYSDKTEIPIKGAPLYENLAQFESAQKKTNIIIPVGQKDLVKKREEEKRQLALEKEREIAEINKQRFSQYQGLVSNPRKEKHPRNVLTRMDRMLGPLRALRECVEDRIRIKVTTRHGTGIRGVLYANLVAFDKQWNLALRDVLEIWRRKGKKKRKIPPEMGVPVSKGTASTISPVPKVTEVPLGGGVWECTRHIPQMMVRGEHVVLVNIYDR